jgi:hypothetical protein
MLQHIDHLFIYKKKLMSSTIMIALIMVGSIALVVGLLVFVNNRDQKKDPAINSHDHLMRVAHRYRS